MKTSNEGIELIKHFEGLESKAYVCPGGKWTIGYGHTKGVKPGDVVTEEQAEELLRADLIEAERYVATYVHAPLRQNQFDALVSFVYNVGCGNFRRSSLLKEVNCDADNFGDIRPRFMASCKSKGKVISGLTRRRKAEADLYCRPIE